MVEWSNTTRCKRVAFGLRGFESLSTHTMNNIEQKQVSFDNSKSIEHMEHRLLIFLTEILKLKIDRGDLYQTVFNLKPEERSRFEAFGGISEEEKRYIMQRSS